MQYKIYHFKSLTSTQDKAKELIKKVKLASNPNFVVIADTQTKGRGRLKRKWYSSKGGLWMSMTIGSLIPESLGNTQYLTFAASVAVVKSIKKLSGITTKIKWPNDVHYRGKKLCGILTEGIFGRYKKDNFVIVGIGLNLNQKRFPDEIKNTATSLRGITKKVYNSNLFLKNILTEFFYLYAQYNQDKLKKILDPWKRYCDTIGKNVMITTQGSTINGMVVDVDKECRLLLRLKNGKVIKVVEGDVLLTKILTMYNKEKS